MADPIMLAVATTVAGKAAEEAFQSGRQALAALVRLVRERLGGQLADDSPGQGGAAPERSEPVLELAARLERTAAADPAFAARLHALWGEVRRESPQVGVDVVNSNSGTVGGHLVQARDLTIQEGLRLGDVHPRP